MKSYVGMDPKYYVGYQHVFKYDAADILEYEIRSDGSDCTSGRSSDTATQVSSTSQAERPAADTMAMAAPQAVLPFVDSPHPPRARQRKPDRKTVKGIDSPAVTSPIRKPGRRPKAAGKKPRAAPAARSSKANNNVAGRQKSLQVKAPPSPPTPRTRPPRNTPKKLWAASKGRVSDPKETKQVQEGGSSHPSRKKIGGPCVSCHVATAATWRRGSEGCAYAGQPLCNRCGVWYSRHPNSPPGAFAAEARMADQFQEDAQQGVLPEGLQGGQQEGQQGPQQGGCPWVSRRRVSTQRASSLSNDSARANSEQPLPLVDSTAVCSRALPLGEATALALAQPISKTTAVDEAATAAAGAPASGMQQCEGGNTLMGRVASAAQDSLLQSLARSVEDSIVGQEAGVQLGQVGGAKMSRKRAAVEDSMQPAAKRRQLDGSLTGGQSKKESLWTTAGAAAARVLGGRRNSMEAVQGEGGVTEGVMASPFDLVLNTVAKGQQNMSKDDWEHV